MTKMFELNDQTHMYLYTDGKKIFITEDEPTKSDNDGKWYHQDIDTLRCMQTFFIDIFD